MKLKSLNLCLIAIVASAALMLTACSDKDLEFDFDLDYADIILDIDSTNTIGTKTLDSILVASVLDSVLKKNNASMDQIKSIKLKKVEFTLLEPAGGNFNSLASCEAFLSAPGLDETKIAFKENIGDGINNVPLDVKDSELVEYMKASSFQLRAVGTNDAPIPAMKIKAVIKYKVTAKL